MDNAHFSRRAAVLAGLAAAAASPALGQPAAAANPRVELRTGAGLIVLELRADRAPITAANFLRYVAAGLYDRATIYRAMRMGGSPPGGLIQGGARFDPAKAIAPIAHESTTQTGLKHLDGTISLARRAPGTATSDFFICVGPAAYLDADPAAAGDNLGFAAFGSVVEGMDVVRAILGMPTSQTAATPEMKGQMLDPPVTIETAKRLP